MAKKITMNKHSGKTFEEVYAAFITSKTAKGVSDVTIRNYHQNLHNEHCLVDLFDVAVDTAVLGIYAANHCLSLSQSFALEEFKMLLSALGN